MDFRLSDIGQGEKAAEFDVVYTRFLLTHLRDPAGAFARMRQVLQPGGAVVVAVRDRLEASDANSGS